MIPVSFNAFYSITNPELNQLTPYSSNSIIKSLFVSCHKEFPPHIITDTLDNMLEIFYPNDEQMYINLDNNNIIYINSTHQCLTKTQNFVATFYLRYNYSNLYNHSSNYSIFGNVLFLSKLNPITKIDDGQFYSVPYQTVQNILEVYDIYTKC